MSLDQKFFLVQNSFYEILSGFFKKIAGFFGYPKNPGMFVFYDFSSDRDPDKSRFLESLPIHRTEWPPRVFPETWFDVIFGGNPKVEGVAKYLYESQEEGFYNFYIENYKNIYFLPDQVSEFIQIKLNICLDLLTLEMIRDVVFLAILVFYQLITLRIAISWFISINPYTNPWCYIAAMVDWTEDVLQGILPGVFGVNIAGAVFLGIVGKIADSLNHLIFTMPFLPSEGERAKLLIDEEMKDVLVFHYLPILWYRHPIPDEIREFWYNKRPDILIYMMDAYEGLDIEFLPDFILKQLSQDKLSLIYDSFIDLTDSYIPTEILSSENLFQLDGFLNHLTFHF